METETINFETEMEITILQTAVRQSKTTQYLLYRTIDKKTPYSNNFSLGRMHSNNRAPVYLMEAL